MNSWHSALDDGSVAQFTMDIMVAGGSPTPPQPPHFRGLHHVVTASFGDSNLFVFDLLRCTVHGIVSEVTAKDPLFWNNTLLPITIGVLGAAVGVLPVHCACLSSKGEGLLIAGVSGAGKSTLSVALAQRGFDFVSDDWTYLSYRDAKLVANGTAAPVKLLPDAVQHYPVLKQQTLRHSLNGELAYEVSAEQHLSATIVHQCEPRRFIFLERSNRPGSELIPIPATQIESYLEASVESLPRQLAAAAQHRRALMMRLTELPCWTYRYGGPPQFAAQELSRLFPIGVGESL
jgi:hypothetical protein